MYEHPFRGMSIALIRFPMTTTQEVQSHCNQVNPGSVLFQFIYSTLKGILTPLNSNTKSWQSIGITAVPYPV